MESWELTWTKLAALNPAEVNKIADSIKGVYRLSYKSDDGKFYVFYVGQSEDLKKKFLEHLAENEQNEGIKHNVSLGKCFFRYAQVSQDYIRSAAEKQMFKHYQPHWNKKEPEGRDDVVVNLT